MKNFWNLLPLALPFLVLVAVLSSCGKNSGVTGQVLNHPKNPSVTVSGQLANGASPSTEATDNTNLRTYCDQNDGRLDMAHGQVCAVRVASAEVDPAKLDPSTFGDAVEIAAAAKKGYAVTSSGTDTGDLDIRLESEHLMNVGETQILKKDGKLEFSLTRMPTGISTAVVWHCIGMSLQEVSCNPNIFKNN